MKKRILTAISLFLASLFYFWSLYEIGQKNLQNLPSENSERRSDTLFTRGWKFQSGDNLQWADPEWEDSSWTTVQTDALPSSYRGEPAWFRLHFRLPGPLQGETVNFLMNHSGASEIFLDGHRITGFGRVAGRADEEVSINPDIFPIHLPVYDTARHCLAIRYSNLSYPERSGNLAPPYRGFALSLITETSARSDFFRSRYTLWTGTAIGVFLITLAFVHLLLFLYYRAARENLYYAAFVFFYSLLFFLAVALGGMTTRPSLRFWLGSSLEALFPLILLSLQLFAQRIFDRKHPRWIWIMLVLCGLLYLVDAVSAQIDNLLLLFAGMWLLISTLITLLLGSWKVWREKRPGSKILASGAGIFAFFIFIALSVLFYSQRFILESLWVALPILGAMLSIPLSMSMYLAYDFSFTNRSLKRKLQEVEELSAQTLRQEMEKQEILSRQKDMLEAQVTERTREVVEQKKVIEEKNKDITDSINYARRIQEALLPSGDQIHSLLPDSFVLYRPKDIVSGDFYFFSEASGRIIIAAIDCTGHGVPGAFMSMMGYNHLRRLITEQGLERPFRILDELHALVLHSLNRDITRRDSKDGMDVAMVALDLSTRHIEFSGAVRPLYYFDDTGFHEIRGDRYSIGGIKEIGIDPYTSAGLQPQGKAEFYLFSDGFADQFGGPDNKKLMTRRFKEILDKIHTWPMTEQQQYLSDFFDQWKGDREQMDDILVIGFRI